MNRWEVKRGNHHSQVASELRLPYCDCEKWSLHPNPDKPEIEISNNKSQIKLKLRMTNEQNNSYVNLSLMG